MVRETRHLWVGNLPDNIREDRIREHFKRYGRVQNVKLLGRTENALASAISNASAGAGLCAAVAFMDIKSASKAHNAEHVIDDRTLTTEYYEPAAIPSTATGAPSAGSSPAGSGYSGSSSSVNSTPAPATSTRYLASSEEATCTASVAAAAAAAAAAVVATAAAPANWRGTNDSASDCGRRPFNSTNYNRFRASAAYSTPPPSVERISGQARWYGSTGGGEESAPSTPEAPAERADSAERARDLVRSGSGAGSSRSASSSPEPSDTSRASSRSPRPAPGHAAHAAPPAHHARRPSHSNQWPSSSSGRPLAICVRNLPVRSTDSSLKDGLYHEYKKHGKVVWVKVVGQCADRYAIVRFKKPSDVDKALEVSQDKLFFGCKISVAPHQSCEEDAESVKPYETDIDEYHPKATRTLFIGNLEKDVTQQQIREKFKHFGRLIEIDIKKGSSGGAGYAFCQYASISSVVEAIRAMDGEYVGSSRVKLGFGKPVATTCVWVDGLTEHTEKQVLGAVSRCGAALSVCVDRAAGAALVQFEQAAAASAAVRELRRAAALLSADHESDADAPRLTVDYASRECQDAFYEQLEKHGGSAALAGSERLGADARYAATARHEPASAGAGGSTPGGEPRARAASFSRSSASRTPRYSPAARYDELGSSPQLDDGLLEDRLLSVVVSPHRSRRHRRDSSAEEMKVKEWHRSVVGTSAGVVCTVTGRRVSASDSQYRSRSGSRRRHRRRRDESASRGGTPLRDEPDAGPAPCEPRPPPPPPRDRSEPMRLPLPKFALQLRAQQQQAPPPPPAPPQPPAPASPVRAPPPPPPRPPRPPSSSSSGSASGGEADAAPHSPSASLEERIRSLDEKYERWSRLDPPAGAHGPPASRLRARLFELDEVKPSEVVRSLLAKRSVFDADSERLEGTTRVPSPPPPPPSLPPPPATQPPLPPRPAPTDLHWPSIVPSVKSDTTVDKFLDHRLRIEKSFLTERLFQNSDSSDNKTLKSINVRLRTPSIENRHEDLIATTSQKHLNDYEVENKTVQNVEITSKDKTQELDTKHQTPTKLQETDKCNKNNFLLLESALPKDISFLNSTKSERNVDNNIDSSNSSTELTTTKEEKSNKDSPPQKHQLSKLTKVEIEINDEISKMILEQTCENRVDNSSNKDIFVKCSESTSDTLLNSTDSPNTTIEPCINADNEVKIIDDAINKQVSLPAKIESDTNINALHKKHDCSISKEADTKLEQEKNKISKDRKPEDRNESEKDKYKGNDKKHDRHEKHEKDDKPRKHDKLEKSDRHERHDRNDKYAKTEQHDKIEKVKRNSLDESEKRHVIDKIRSEKEKTDIDFKEKIDQEQEKPKRSEEKFRHDHSRKDRKNEESLDAKPKKEERHKHDKHRKEHSDAKRETRKESESKSRKSSRDESSRDISRKDSTDSSTSRASMDSTKAKEIESNISKEDWKQKQKSFDIVSKIKTEKDSHTEIKQDNLKVKKVYETNIFTCEKIKQESDSNSFIKFKSETIDKRHNSLDSSSIDNKRKERLSSCSSLPPNTELKRRLSSHDNYESNHDEPKKIKQELKCPERRSSKDSRYGDKPKPAKFNKCHFAKLIESKTKDEKKNLVKTPDDALPEGKYESKERNYKQIKKSPKYECEEKPKLEDKPEILQNDLDFLALFELRSSEEDEKQKALRNEMKEKKRLQQLQQIHELQIQQDALQQAELLNRKKVDEKRKEAAREKRFSTDRKSRDDKCDPSKRRQSCRKLTNTSDSSDSDEPKKHSIFDIVDDGPTYISMYDKVKARSCKNMQKQEEEKRQEKIKAKFSQLKQSRAKREEKKRSSWDEDSDSDRDSKHSPKTSVTSSTDDEQHHIKKHEKIRFDSDRSLTNDFLEDEATKQARKNSRSRIMSDTSDDENLKRNVNRISNICDQVKKELAESEMFSSQISKTRIDKSYDMPSKEATVDRIKKNSLLNLFGKSDIEENKVKLLSGDIDDYKNNYFKKITDVSSENESFPSKYPEDKKRKNKVNLNIFKISHPDEDARKNLHSSTKIKLPSELNIKQDNNKRITIKHDKFHDSKPNDLRTDNFRTDINEFKKDKNEFNDENYTENTSYSTKRDGKMEDIFGPLSDESDYAMFNHYDEKCKTRVSNSNLDHHQYERSFEDIERMKYSRERDEMKRRKDRRRKEKEKRLTLRDDDNSLDVDAVGKAIEARLFADTDSETRVKEREDTVEKNETANYNEDLKAYEEQSYRNKRDSREKKKKKKRNKDDRLYRREHHGHNKYSNHQQKHEARVQKENTELKHCIYESILPKSPPESASLAFITDSPPVLDLSEDPKSPGSVVQLTIDESMDVPSQETDVEPKAIVLSSPEPIENSNHNLLDSSINTSNSLNIENNKPESENTNESAVRGIPNIDREITTSLNLSDSLSVTPKAEEIEKPRAVISQEETEDAVAALLGESFGGNSNFNACYDENNKSPIAVDPQLSPLASETIPEVDAEEMRQAVQNLNASEMELKPDTPVSDSDLLLIDTDTEETEESQTESTEKLSTVFRERDTSITTKTNPIDSANEADSKLRVNLSSEPLVSEPINIKTSAYQTLSTSAGVISSWTVNKNAACEPRLVTISKSNIDNKPQIGTNIIQVNTTVSNVVGINTIRPLIEAAVRGNNSYQVLNQMVHAQLPKVQPPTIKIPEQHIIYQKQQGIVISPRMNNDPRLLSPKSSQGLEGISSPRIPNMAILSSSPQNINSACLTSPNNLQQRSPGQVTLVRVQQPPLSPIQAMNLPHGTRAMISPNRPNSLLVQTQGPPIHFNRLPVTPVLAPISKPFSGNVIQSNKTISLNQLQQQSGQGLPCKEPRLSLDGSSENTKIYLSAASLAPSTNSTIIAQNRLITMQNIHVSNIGSTIQLSNKVIMNKLSPLPDKKEVQNTIFKQEPLKSENNIPFAASPFIHVAGINQTANIVQSNPKPIASEENTSRDLDRSVVHSRLLTAAPMTNIIKIDTNKAPSVLSMAPIRPSSVLSKITSSHTSVASTTSMTNVVMTPLLLQTDNQENRGVHLPLPNYVGDKSHDNINSGIKRTPLITDAGDKRKPLFISAPLITNQSNAKCETDFEELLRDKTNEIKVTHDPQKKLEVNIGKTTMVVLAQTKFEQNELPSMNVAPDKPVHIFLSNTVTENSQISTSEVKNCNKSENKVKLDIDNVTTAINAKSPTNSDSMNKIEDCDSWSAKDVNIDSVIKKVDSLCNDNIIDVKDENKTPTVALNETIQKEIPNVLSEFSPKLNLENDNNTEEATTTCNENNDKSAKRGGRTVRSKKSSRAQDRVQTRQVARPLKGSFVAKRGKGKANSDKRLKSTAAAALTSNFPGDVYDFHEDSGDETNSEHKSESLPRLILTIKSPLAAAPNNASLVGAGKDQPLKVTDMPSVSNRDDKEDEFSLPSSNTRKSRRLQEKDVQRPFEEADEKVIGQSKSLKDLRKRPARLVGAKVNYAEKTLPKPFKPTKRTRESMSDTSIDDGLKDSKVPRLPEPTSIQASPTESKLAQTQSTDVTPTATVTSASPSVTTSTVASTATPLGASTTPTAATPIAPAPSPITTSTPITTPTPITKPPKKMISEISAKLASAFETAAATPPKPAPLRAVASPPGGETKPYEGGYGRLGAEADEPPGRFVEHAGGAEPMPAATGEARPEAGFARSSLPVGALEAAAARAQSPALPGRAPRSHAAPGLPPRLHAHAVPSLPRGAHHPAPPAACPAAPLRLPHHAGSTARMTVTSVPNLSPQGQIGLATDLVRSPPPAHQQTSPITPGDGIYPHFSHQHYQMYQQHFRATQHEARSSPAPYSRGFEAEGCEAGPGGGGAGGSLELRRAPPPGPARVPRPAHSPAPHDRLILYGVVGGRSPPPAHAHAHAHAVARPPSALPSPGPPGPPHASQVPREADSLQMLLRRYPVMWQGLLALKNDCAAVQMHFVGGNPGVAGGTLPRHTDGSTPPLRIAQRMRLEPHQLDQVHRKMKLENEHCILLALPCGRDHMDVLQQSTNLTAGFITYLQRKQAAGIVNVAPPGHHQAMYTVHIFPSCDFANENLNRIAPDLMHRVADIAHLLIVIATV